MEQKRTRYERRGDIEEASQKEREGRRGSEIAKTQKNKFEKIFERI
jgi:hypothetical protein